MKISRASLLGGPWALPVALVAALALAGCGAAPSSTLILATISGVPSGTRTLRATSYLNGQRERDPVDLSGLNRELVVRLGADLTGRYRLEIEALGDDGCSFAQGQAEVAIGAERRIELPIALGSPGFTSCTLSIRKQGRGPGYVESDPLGITCGTPEGIDDQECFFPLQKGVTVRLVARPSSRASFDGWTDACLGVGSCEVTMVGPRSVGATFGVSAQ